MNILIVDDSAAMRMLIQKTLRQAGFGDSDFSQAPDGVAALELINDSNPDLILADWNMPNMTGIDLLRSLRAQGNEVTFGFVTSESTKPMVDLSRKIGAKFFISKPFTVETFKNVLGPLCD